LFNHGGMIEANGEAVYEQLRDEAVEVRARIGDDPVGAVGRRRVTKVRNDRMGADWRVDAQVAESQEERVPRGKLAGARRELAAKSVSEHVGLVERQEHFMGLAEPVWSPAELGAKLSKTAAGKR